MAVTKLILFDIDGTLVRTGGAGVKAFERTFADIFGLPDAAQNLQFAGRTDVSLVREFFRRHSVEESEANFRRFFEVYPEYLAENLKVLPGAVLPGMQQFIDELFALTTRPVVGLLTGNIRRGAELKLSRFGLWDKFETGAFADDNEDRNCIAAIAKERGEQMLGRTLAGEEIVVIGDTPLDVACAKSIGARCLAVATGIHRRDQLAEVEPDWAVDQIGEVPMEEILGR